MKKYLAIAAAFLCVMLAASHSYAQTPCVVGTNYTTAATAGVIVPGTVDTGNHIDDGTTTIALPFPVRIYDQGPFNSANVSSNGNIQFVSNNPTLANACPLPSATVNAAILPYWDDLRTDQIGTGCAAFPAPGCGIYTSISGIAPNRIFNVEWRAVYFGANTTTANFEVRLHEANALFEVVYGTTAQTGSSGTAGVQRDTGSFFTQFGTCNTAGSLPNNTQVAYTCPLLPVELMGVTVE